MSALLVLQILHGATFGAAHLGAIHFIAQRMEASVSVTAQSVYSAAVSGVGEDKARQRDNFHKNVVGTRLYYGDMLGEEAAQKMDDRLAAADTEEKEEILAAFRDLHAGTAHHRQGLARHSLSTHTPHHTTPRFKKPRGFLRLVCVIVHRPGVKKKTCLPQ